MRTVPRVLTNGFHGLLRVYSQTRSQVTVLSHKIDVQRKSTVVLLLQLGENPEHAAELYQMFFAPVRGSEQLFAVKELISRLPSFQRSVNRISKSSPSVHDNISQQFRVAHCQAELLQKTLESLMPELVPINCKVAYVLSKPSIEDALLQCKGNNIGRVVLLPMYQHYWCFQSGSCINEVARLLRLWTLPSNVGGSKDLNTREFCDSQSSDPVTFSLIDRFPAHPSLVDAVSAMIRSELQTFPEDVQGNVAILYVAPYWKSFDAASYYREIAASALRISQNLENKHPHRLALYRSWYGFSAVPFTEAHSLPKVLRELVRSGHPDILVVPIAQVSDSLDTLVTLPNLLSDKALKKVGAHHVHVLRPLNTNPIFIQGLAEVVKNHLMGTQRPIPQFALRCRRCVSPICRFSREIFL